MTSVFFAQYTSPQKGPVGYRWHITAPMLESGHCSSLKSVIDRHDAFPSDGRSLPLDFTGGAYFSPEQNYGAVFRFLPGSRDAAGRSGKIVLNCLFFHLDECVGKSLKILRESPELANPSESGRQTELVFDMQPLNSDGQFFSDEFDQCLSVKPETEKLILLKSGTVHSFSESAKKNPEPVKEEKTRINSFSERTTNEENTNMKNFFFSLIALLALLGIVFVFLMQKDAPRQSDKTSTQILAKPQVKTYSVYIKRPRTKTEKNATSEYEEIEIGKYDAAQGTITLVIPQLPENAKSAEPDEKKTQGADDHDTK